MEKTLESATFVITTDELREICGVSADWTLKHSTAGSWRRDEAGIDIVEGVQIRFDRPAS